jgi:glycosyltransferase involved in cell wall biosynthesis
MHNSHFVQFEVPTSSIFAAMARIALNARLLIPDRLEGIGWFTHSIYQRIIASHPEHEFLLLFDRAPSSQFDYGLNAEMKRVWPPARRPVLVDAWMDGAIPLVLRQWGADAFISTDGFISRRVAIPQLSVMHDLNFEHHPEWLPARDARHYQRRFRAFAQIAKRIATVSDHSKEDIHRFYAVPMDQIDVVYNAPSTAFEPLNPGEKLQARSHWNDGKPYYCFVGSIHPRKNIQGLLDAHRTYRNEGGSADLLIVGKPMWNEIPSEWQSMTGVRWMGRLGSKALETLLGGAEGLVYLPHFEGFGIPLVEAMSAGVPVIASNTTSLPEVLGGAGAALVAPNDAAAAASAMLRLDQDPEWRANRVKAGLSRAARFSWDDSAQLFWRSIEKILM